MRKKYKGFSCVAWITRNGEKDWAKDHGLRCWPIGGSGLNTTNKKSPIKG